MTFQCPRCLIYVPDGLQVVHETRCRGMAAPNLGHHAYSSRPFPHTTHISHHPPFASQLVIPQTVITPRHPHAAVAPSYTQAVITPPIAQGSRRGLSDSDSWRRELEELRKDILWKIDKSNELRMEDRQICSEYVNNVKVYQNLVVYTYAHIKLCTNDRRLLDELKRKIMDWIGWYGNGGDLRILTKHRYIRDDLKRLLNQTQTLCPVHVSVEVTRQHMVPYDDEVALRGLLVICGRDYENEFYDLAGDQAQGMVDLLEEVLRDPSIDDATHARLMRYIIRLSRKSGRLPCQLLLDIRELHQMNVVGHGGSATIYRASFEHKTVAVKRSHLPHCHRDFVSEAVIWSHLKHENIVPFIGVMEKEGSLWLVSRFMYSGNVRTHLEILGRNNCDLRHLAEGVAKGLYYLHTLDPPIVHGDLKGYNVLIDSGGNACLVDFGISRSYDSRQILDSTRQASLNWLAPELFFGNLRVTLETDIYAFACVLYEIYTGRIPFDKLNVMQCLEKRKRPSLQELGGPVKRLIEECWQHEPRQRMTAPAVVEALQNMNMF